MAVKITGVQPGSPCYGKVETGECLISVNSHEIADVLDYKFYSSEKHLTLLVENEQGKREIKIEKGEYEDPGLLFETYLMDKHRSCKNKCVFCFIDQLPRGMRESLYFKDDDSRLSFFFGNYITLTNLTEREVERIIEMKISPVNVSVHTMNPALRCRMMNNKTAGECLKILTRLADAGIRLNTQLVLCPGINDGAELEFSLKELAKLYPALQSIAAVPVGLTKHREGLYPLRLFTPEESGAVIDIIDSFNDEFYSENSVQLAYAADEFYLNSAREFPCFDSYGDFPQLENGVGLWRLMADEYYEAVHEFREKIEPHAIDIATGVAAYPLIKEFAEFTEEEFPCVKIRVHKIINHFFGETITVAGLITGQDLVSQLDGSLSSDTLLIPEVTLRSGEEVFLDDMTLGEASKKLNVKIIPVKNSGFDLLNLILKGSEM